VDPLADWKRRKEQKARTGEVRTASGSSFGRKRSVLCRREEAAHVEGSTRRSQVKEEKSSSYENNRLAIFAVIYQKIKAQAQTIKTFRDCPHAKLLRSSYRLGQDRKQREYRLAKV